MLKLAAVKKKMKKKPKGQRLYDFFTGQTQLLTPHQIDEVERIIDADYQNTKEFLKEARQIA